MSKTVIYDSDYFKQQEKLRKATEHAQKEKEKATVIFSCPCCGGNVRHCDNFERHTIECSECRLTTPQRNTFESCLDIWNNRKAEKNGSGDKRVK